ncbi:MAG: lysylphosphatidylglycerol synthase transmembrane domain-containing protein [Pirellulales bacterium]
MSEHKIKWTRWLLGTVKLSVFALLSWFIYRALVSANEQLNGHQWHVEPGWLAVAGLLYLVGLFPAALFWHRVLLQTGQEAGLGESLRAYYISQLGKYVPGKWMVILLRRGLLTGGKVETTVVAASVFFETFVMLAIGASIATLALLVWHPGQIWLIAIAAGSALLLGIPTIPRLFEFLLRMVGVGRLNPTAGARFRRIGRGMLAAGWIAIGAGWLLQGMSLWATLRAMGAATGGPLYDLSLHTSTVALSVVAGFLSQIPGGLAVREWVSAELIEPTYGASVAIVSAIIYRLVQVVSELAVSIILYVAGWRRTPRAAKVAEAELSASSGR